MKMLFFQHYETSMVDPRDGPVGVDAEFLFNDKRWRGRIQESLW
ncbi:hypothetical protein ACFQ5Q_00020 [Luteolibacter ambystomatis]|nr:hypothetical protein [Luteolibacter ambystomatis]